MQEGLASLVGLAIIVGGFVVLGVAWLVYLGRGGKPVHVAFEGLGIKVDIARPSGSEQEQGDESDVRNS